MKKLTKILAAALIVLSVTSCGPKKAKYVFLFIGDGMGFGPVNLAEAYRAQSRGVIGMDPLNFTQFPVMGEATTYCADSPITCSSAAGTALATGSKTNIRMLGIAPDSTTNLTSIAYKIHDAGYSVGITSTVQVNHATPAAFYGHNIARSAYYPIGLEIPQTDFEFFAGGGLLHPTGKKGEDLKSLYEVIAESGYTVANGYDDFLAKKDSVKDHILMVQSENSASICPYALGHKEGDLQHKDIVNAAVEILSRNTKGFFLMSEGGEIDWTAHSNDLAGTIYEIYGFEEAIEVALEFYRQHPDETLIIVTADHNTGGVSLGYERGYKYDLTVIDSITESSTTSDVEKYMDDQTAIDSINVKARVGWTTLSHTGDPVPVWAIGACSEKFAGRMDNTDIPKRICTAMGVEF